MWGICCWNSKGKCSHDLYRLLDQLVDKKALIGIFLFYLQGVLDSAGFPAVVTAHFVPVEGQQRPRTTILIKFAEEVLASFSLIMTLFL